MDHLDYESAFGGLWRISPTRGHRISETVLAEAIASRPTEKFGTLPFGKPCLKRRKLKNKSVTRIFPSVLVKCSHLRWTVALDEQETQNERFPH